MPGEGSSLSHPNWHVRVISTPGPDTDLSILVFFDNARFLIGCGEGTQRAFIQKKLGLKGLAGVFLPNSENRVRGGLAGVLMTAADAGSKEVDVIGPPDTSHQLATLRSCVNRDKFKVNPVSFPSGFSSSSVKQVYKSPFITVSAIALSSSSSHPTLSTEDAITAPTEDGSLPFDPCKIDFRPSQLPPDQIRLWRDTIVRSMFGRNLHKPLPLPPTLAEVQETLRRDTPHYLLPPFVHSYTNNFVPSLPLLEYRLPLPLPSETTDMVYIFQAPQVRGKFDVKKANELKVPSGPIRGRLTKGESVEVDDDSAPGGKRIVTPQDCLVGGGPGAALIVVSCSPENLQSLLDSTAFDAYFASSSSIPREEKLRAHAVIHRTSGAVYNDGRYRQWMVKFGPETQHLIADPEDYTNDTFFTSAAWNVLHLSRIDSHMFPYPWSNNPSRGIDVKTPLPPHVQLAAPNQSMKMHPPGSLELAPRHAKDKPFPTSVEEAGAARELLSEEMPDFVNACNVARTSRRNDPQWKRTPHFPGHDIAITTLGTGSAMPSKYRNVSSTLLQIPGVGGVLLDCGEGSLGQLRRRFGPEGLHEVYKELRMIFISHMHADHHLGLQAILEDRYKHGAQSKLYLIAPSHIALALQESPGWQEHATDEGLANLVHLDCHFGHRTMWNVSDGLSDIDYTPSSPSSPGPDGETRRLYGLPSSWIEEDMSSGARKWPATNQISGFRGSFPTRLKITQEMMSDLGLAKFQTPPVDHRGKAYGLVIESKAPESWKIVYSGDTKPCDRLVEAGMNATLLIHEATLEDDKPETAAVKGHSTFGQAIEVGKRMKAKHILLNHFSQRYPKVPIWSNSNDGPNGEDESQPVISISFDLMTARISDLWKMRHYLEPISVLFAETEVEEGDDSTMAVEHDINAGAEDMDADAEEATTNGVQPSAQKKGPGPKKIARHKPQSPNTHRVVGKKRSSTPPSARHGKKPKEASKNEGDVEMNGSTRLDVPKASNIEIKASEAERSA